MAKEKVASTAKDALKKALEGWAKKYPDTAKRYKRGIAGAGIGAGVGALAQKELNYRNRTNPKRSAEYNKKLAMKKFGTKKRKRG